jgi:phosphoglycerate dehydrogenase-like enzyme
VPTLLLPGEIAAGDAVRTAAEGCEVVVYDGPAHPPTDEVLARVEFYIPPYMGAAANYALMRAMPRLRVVQLPTAGYEAALADTPAHATLCNAGGVHDASTAELTLALILASLRRVDDFARAMPEGQWLYGRYDALADRRVCVIGHGGVGRAIIARLRPFEVEIVAVASTARDGVHAMADLPELLPACDVVVLAVPLSETTRHMVDAGFLARMKPGALLVNVGRGGLVDTDALRAAAAEGRVRAALDVTDPEPLPPTHPLWQTPGVLISPHVGGNTSAFLPRMRACAARQIGRWRAGEPLADVVRAATVTLPV